MVSFQCSGCGDIVKKPKLDTHYARCHASVDCIDCSTTFSVPAEFKSHTSCITEAEKYQRGLYKGPKAKQDRKQNRVKGKVNGDDEQMKIDEQAGDLSKEQPEKGVAATDEKLVPAAPEPSKPSNSSEETIATATSTGKAKDKKRKEKKSKSKDITDNKNTPKIETSATIADLAPVPTPASPEKATEPIDQKLRKENEREKIEKSEDAATKDGDLKADHKVEDEGREKTEAKKSKKKKNKQKIPDSTTAIVEDDGKGAKEDTAMDVDELKIAPPQDKNEESKDKHNKKKRKDASTAGAMKEAEAKEQPKSPEKEGGKTEKKPKKETTQSDVKTAMAGDGEGINKAKDDDAGKKRKRGDAETDGGGVSGGNDKKAKKKKGDRVPDPKPANGDGASSKTDKKRKKEKKKGTT